MEVLMVETICPECGCPFAMPGALYTARHEDGENFYCPNGHPLSLEREAVNDPAEVERHRLRILALHEQEQAEARAADGRGRCTDPDVSNGRLVLHSRGARLCCPFCDRTYANLGGLAHHLRSRHDRGDLSGLLLTRQVEVVPGDEPT